MSTNKPTGGARSTNTQNVQRIEDWRCYEVLQAMRTERSHHIVGSICSTLDHHEVREGCVTSAIASVDPARRAILTEDGTAYALGRCREMTPDAFYIWRRWQRAAQATNVVEVTVDINGVLAPETDGGPNTPRPLG